MLIKLLGKECVLRKSFIKPNGPLLAIQLSLNLEPNWFFCARGNCYKTPPISKTCQKVLVTDHEQVELEPQPCQRVIKKCCGVTFNWRPNLPTKAPRKVMSKPAEKRKLSSNAIGLEHKKVYYEKLRGLPLSQYLVVTTAMSNEVILQTKNLYISHVQPSAPWDTLKFLFFLESFSVL